MEESPLVRVEALRRQAGDLGADSLEAPIVRRLVAVFLENAHETVPILSEAADENDWATARDAAHRLKGGASHVGAVAMTKASRALEQAVREEELDQARHAADKLPDLLANTEEQLRETVGPLPE